VDRAGGAWAADLGCHFSIDIGHNDRTGGIDPLRD